MEEEKKVIKKANAYTLSPDNITWLAQRAIEESTPEKRVTASSLLDRIVTEARLNAESSTPSKKNAPSREVALVA